MRALLALAALAFSASTVAYADGYSAPYQTTGNAPFSWTGFYVGGNAGSARDADQRDLTLTNTLFTVTTRGPEARGGFVGLQAGYNWQSGPLVLGVETDIQGGNVKDEFGRVIDGAGDNLSARKRLDYFGTVRGRLGFALDRFLVYGTGGFAYGGINDELRVTNPAVVAFADGTKHDTGTGWVAGGGVEFALDRHLSLKVEFQHLDFGSDKISAIIVPPPGNTITSNRIEHTFDTVRLGFNWRFGEDRYAPLK
jgi:outer membrane immunogenic protein